MDRTTQTNDQITGSPEAAHSAQIEGRLKDLHTMLPGIIAGFDPETQVASVQPCIKRIFTERGPVNLPVCVDVPVAFPGGGDFFLTFPVKAGDECILMFSERAFDYWHAAGGIQSPAEYRMHDLSDGIAVVGLNSQPNKLSALQMTGTELRTRSRSTYIRLEDGTIYIKGDIVHEGNMDRTGSSVQSGVITGNGGMAVDGGTGVTMVGAVNHTGTITSNGKDISDTHKHAGVTPGSGQTGSVV